MEIYEAIRGRRTMGRVKQDPVPRETVERLLEAANWAPSHHATEPWRFFVMTGEGRDVLAQAYADIAAEQAQTEDAEALAEIRAKQAAKAYRAPVVIAAAVSPSDDPKADRREELAAAHAAVQNLLLAAHAEGLGAIWRSGEPMYDPIMSSAFGLKEGDALVGLIYLGYPAVELPEGRRRPVEEKTVWLTGQQL
ncbi:nitroreductase family protein [Paenibacillus tarimensis]|uniref:nitroreductase family protein n=1 Tax=Paenibacillus tarimensis TaxID=416012 RepID=UPI001F36A0D2|nr:nitroreductase [Paenibacillus tarimensis]MCF2944901.1 nitroreductase [Paenibacillus tarimensis]